MRLYVALNAKDIETNEVIGHVTVCFMENLDVKTDKLFLNNLSVTPFSVNISSVNYWETPDITVAILEDSGDLQEIKSYLDDRGFTYNLEFIPHITLAKEDKVCECSYFISKTLTLCDPYLRIF